MLIGPINLYDGHVAKNLENAWQFSKVYKEHIDADENISWEEYFKEFGGEVRYCSDRMSLDRLFHCHWLLNAAINKHKFSTDNSNSQ